jgi:predicted nucleic acid-binding protein
MTTETFVDTSGYFSLVNRNDHLHAVAKSIAAKLAKDATRLVTTDYVIDETVTLLQSRNLGYVARPWLDQLFSNDSIEIVWMNAERFEEVRRFFTKHADKEWSFTDCFSFCVMRERQISQALASDQHFRQAGYLTLIGA